MVSLFLPYYQKYHEIGETPRKRLSLQVHHHKNFTTAEGGASTWLPLEEIDDAEIYKMYQLLSLHGQNKDALAKTKIGAWEYDIIGPWYKCNMTDVVAAIGIRQLDAEVH